ncbi:MAG: hypothetical protein ACYTE3_28830, partial [Planctomycetota bacterium]
MRRLEESLSEYALGLPQREKNALCEMLVQAMEPLDRFLYIKTTDLLSPDEEEVLHSLENRSKRGRRPATADLLLVVKVTRQCTLRCAYCNDWRDNRKGVMSFPVMAHMIACALAEH